MANLTETSTYEAGIYQLERTDAVDAGIGGNGVANLQARQLANRTKWLYDTVVALSSGLTIGEEVQAWDADLDALAALTGTGIVRRTGSGAFSTVNQWVNNNACQGRLSLSSSDPLAGVGSDVTAQTNVHFVPYLGNRIALYTGSEWQLNTFTATTLSLSGAAADTNWDIFGFLSGGNLTLERIAWTNATTRATALVLVDGVWCKTGETTKRYLGTIRTTSVSGQCEDSVKRRFVYNAQNQIGKKLLVRDPSTWTYNSATPRPLNNSTANRIEVVIGLQQNALDLKIFGSAGSGLNGGVDAFLGIGINSTTTGTSEWSGNLAYGSEALTAQLLGTGLVWLPVIGYTFFQAIEASIQSNACEFIGGNIALTGVLNA